VVNELQSPLAHDGTQNDKVSRGASDEKTRELCATGVHFLETPALPVDLQGVVTAWPTLPEHIRAAVLALVGTVKP